MTSKLQSRGNELSAELHVAFDFPVRFTKDVFAPSNQDLLAVIRRREPFRRHRVFFVFDSGLVAAQPGLPEAAASYARAHKGSLTLAAPPLVLEGGERAKSRAGLVDWLRARLAAAQLDRQSHVVVVGGGAVLDAAGYAAATLRRGLRVTRVPSTVLAQADSCVALNCGVNALGRKDMVGTFAPPFAVVCDLRMLDSLPERARRAGLSEALKVGLVRDADFFHWICDNATRLAAWERRVVDTAVRWSARLHLDHIARSGDPFEQGRARPIDFGHWASRTLERLTDHKLGHGEAVAIGVAIDVLLSRELCGLPDATVEAAHGALEQLRLPLWHPALEQSDPDGRRALVAGLDDFREHRGGELSVLLLHEIADPVEVESIDEGALLRALGSLKGRKKRRR